MSNTKRKKILNYRNGNGLAPNPNNIDYGEIAIGYKKDNEAIYIKNSIGNIVDFTPISIINITYSELKNLRDNSKLKPSQYYRITDFVTTVDNDPEAQSAGHPFDIIVMASDKNKLQEECYAIQHEGDTYFANCNLAAWKIWYCLDNDNTKYAWADTTNGTGVIYRMIDEWGNDCPYDFKNVQFKRYAVADASSNGTLADLEGTYIGYNSSMNGLRIPDQDDFTWAYTFTYGYRTKEEIPVDASNMGLNLGDGYGSKGYYGDNIIKPSTCHIVNDAETNTPFCLNNIVWYDVNSAHHGTTNNIIVESECVNMTLSGSAHHIGYDNRNLIMGIGCISNTIGSGGDMNTFGNTCCDNSFGDNCVNNLFGMFCINNTFGNYCFSNTFGNNCVYNSFENCCYGNTFGNVCSSNSFGNDCRYNSFGNDCNDNTFGNDCYRNSFGNNFQHNALGNDVNYIEIPTEKIYYTQILNGTQGTVKNKLTIEFTPQTTYSQFAGLTSDGVLETWVESDAPHDVVNITYNKLKELRDNSKLKPSQHYRITDFVTTVANDEEARSAGHPFDIIVMASEKNKLQEECYAIQHKGDTYFANCNLAAWKIWYCLDNDNTKYMWADTVDGKGVIYRMIDEWQNDCPYDFKNVQFKRYWANGVNTAKTGEPKNIILQGYYGTASNTDIFTEGVDTNDYLYCFTFTRLNNILAGYVKGGVIQSNVLDESIQTEGFDMDAGDDKLNNPFAYNFHNRCRNNILKPTETGLVVDTKEYMTFTLLNNVFITVKVEDGYEAYQPPFDNTLGVSCVNNTFGTNIYGLLFLSRCNNNTFGDDCHGNTFGNDCTKNTFGFNCYSNTFVDRCVYNSFGINCSDNSFGNDCHNNSFGGGCRNNTFGNECIYNTFGIACYFNTFGNECIYNTFGDYFQYNALGNDVLYIEIPTDRIYHTHILNGTKGTRNNKLTIVFTPETTYSQFAGLTSNGVLETWVEADAPHDTVDGGSY